MATADFPPRLHYGLRASVICEDTTPALVATTATAPVQLAATTAAPMPLATTTTVPAKRPAS